MGDEEDVYSEVGEELYLTPVAGYAYTTGVDPFTGASPENFSGGPANVSSGLGGMTLTPAAFNTAIGLSAGECSNAFSNIAPVDADCSWASNPAYTTTSFTTFADIHPNNQQTVNPAHESSQSPPPPPSPADGPFTPVDITTDYHPVPDIIHTGADQDVSASDSSSPLRKEPGQELDCDDLPPPPSPLIGKPKRTPPATLPRPVKPQAEGTGKGSRRRSENEGALNIAAEAAAAAIARRGSLRSASQKDSSKKKVWRAGYR